jgi:uncharacterized membrane protein
VIATRPPATASRRNQHLVVAVLVIAACSTDLWVLSGSRLPWIGPTAGFLFAIGLPAWMLSQKIDWRTDQPSERLVYSVVSAILALMLLGLAMNTALPRLGVTDPLGREPVLVGINAWCLTLAFWRPTKFKPSLPQLKLSRLKGIDWFVGLASALCVPMAIIGANRLNNGAGDSVTLLMLIATAVIFTSMLIKREQLNPGTITVAIYFIALAMLLMTSLRGWYTTGHDIQEEYRVFELTKSHGDWDIARYRNAYNACLSITILPTMLWQMLRVDDPYVFKFWFQLLFALCPVFVYRISVRHTTRALAIIATIYFVAFPTYFTDMPFLNRQEIAFLFVAACVMTATDPGVSQNKIRLRLAFMSIGAVLSHYSTTYVFLGTITLGWVCYRAWLMFVKLRHRGNEVQASRRDANPIRISPAIGVVNIIVVLAGVVLWNGVATDTVSGLKTTLTQAAESLRGGTDQKASEVSYSFLSLGSPSLSQLLKQYNSNTLTETSSARLAGDYYPGSLLKKYPIKLLPEPNLPITTAGHLVDDTGLSVSSINSIIRAGSAKVLQLFVALGLIAAIFSRTRRPRDFIELIALSIAALIIVALQVILPVISVDYGVLRAFLQALIVFGPLVAVGSFVIYKPLGNKWGLRAASSTAILFFLSLTGILPQILGGYPAQLHLNNSGEYYDIYYLHPQEITAIQWLQDRVSNGSIGQIQSEVETDRYTFRTVQTFTDLSPVNDIYPTLLRENAYVFLGYTTINKDQATFSYNGDLITYQYPLGLLNSTKDLVYSSNGARIYR